MTAHRNNGVMCLIPDLAWGYAQDMQPSVPDSVTSKSPNNDNRPAIGTMKQDHECIWPPRGPKLDCEDWVVVHVFTESTAMLAIVRIAYIILTIVSAFPAL